MRKKKRKQKVVSFAGSGFYFDDCPVCQAMKQAEETGKVLSEAELKLAFKEAKSHGAIVGGPLVEGEDEAN